MNTAFKEWAIICEALGRGRQSVILRKGGIAEGRAGFAFKHKRFFLYPTLFHQQNNLTHWNESPEISLLEKESIIISYFCELQSSCLLEDWSIVKEFAPMHIWNESVIKERFDYQDAGAIHIALVRTKRLATAVELPYISAYKGCKSWIELTGLPNDLTLQPVLSDNEYKKVEARFNKIISKS